jgi:hypothetical protein
VDPNAEMLQLLREIRDSHREHLERYKAFTAKIEADQERARQDADRAAHEQAYSQQQLRQRLDRGQLVTWIILGVFLLLLFGIYFSGVLLNFILDL